MKTSQKQSRMSRSALRRQREKEQRCQTMLKAAETLFARKGYHQAGMEEIADLAEVSTGAVYFYFKNKEDLLVRLTEDIGFFLREWLGRELEKNKLTIDGFCNIARAFLKDFCVRYPEKITIFFRESAGQSREMEEHRKTVFERLTGEVEEALVKVSQNLKRNFTSPAAPRVMAICIVGIYERMACQYVLWQDEKKDINPMVEEAVAFMRGGIKILMEPEAMSG